MAAPAYHSGNAVPPVIVDGVVKRFGDAVALDGIAFTVEVGEVVALLGPNGAGKTTTLEICEGFMAPDRGTVRILGLDPRASRERLRPHVGVMVQGNGGYPGIRAREMLELAASCAAAPLDVAWLIDTLGLAEVARTTYRRLSGGQRQRLSLACALVGRPEVVFLDEPTEGLDPVGQHLVWDLVRQLSTDGVAVIVTTHAIDEAEKIADRVIIVDRGRVIANGSPAQINRGNTDNDLVFRSLPELDIAALCDVLGSRFNVDESAPGCYRVRGPIAPAVMSAITAWGAAGGILLSDLHIERAGLTSTFIDLTRRQMSTR
ncbi:ABC-type multidrug transport system, ATPase component [uncultured Mycobacterium sp.]|uniref:ABC-type multidrug transport system, ATPase component n=1 Tax=uncultured Mycobacterium sp. TaxID=171292 RepID=A0A1Y5PU07_9MYCO|nr:ABC-type multidrug transport system, ATPase component [uncultured Mycobacterium sp.]